MNFKRQITVALLVLATLVQSSFVIAAASQRSFLSIEQLESTGVTPSLRCERVITPPSNDPAVAQHQLPISREPTSCRTVATSGNKPKLVGDGGERVGGGAPGLSSRLLQFWGSLGAFPNPFYGPFNGFTGTGFFPPYSGFKPYGPGFDRWGALHSNSNDNSRLRGSSLLGVSEATAGSTPAV